MDSPTLPDMDAECFFIAPIGDEGSDVRNRSDGVLEFIVQKAAQELNLTAVRGDQIAEPGQINLQVLDHILRAKAAVADLTDLNPNVFYELAVRHTAKLPVVLIADKSCEVPFDIAQMRIITFDHKDLKSADNCRAQIVTHLRQVLTSGNTESPISTTLDVLSLQVGSPVERSVAEIVTSVEEVARTQREMLHYMDRMTDDVRGRYRNEAALEHALLRASKLSNLEDMTLEEAKSDAMEIVEALQYLRGRRSTVGSRNLRRPVKGSTPPDLEAKGSSADLL
ncbi:hypothetical protein FHS35_003862 [Streptomyces umbrinus]|uniref:hypothetical protein n=1 Tax=Streptomyces umbrinus TaxID=67370 RepID=UPI00167DA5C5|nr:hypothetical protein [Streptomyces umbrinus]MCR3727007.1 hypothetical protein [Streptomyces umbrinus]GHH55282.1 hypothetical protein GCM10018775_59870 [Streptomyces umbrinus]